MEFTMFKKAIQDHFAELSRTADHLFEVEVDKDKLWNLYLGAVSECRCGCWPHSQSQHGHTPGQHQPGYGFG